MPSEARGAPTREIAGELRGNCVGASKPDSGQTIRVLCEPARRSFSPGIGSTRNSNRVALESAFALSSGRVFERRNFGVGPGQKFIDFAGETAVNSCWSVIPHRRATADTTAPGANEAPIARAFGIVTPRRACGPTVGRIV